MKKTVLFFASALMCLAASAQTIVSTQVEKRNVVLEEFTGYRCQYCPDGHRLANELCEQFAGHAWAINIHTGYYATGSGYTTTYGDNIAGLFSISGYPCGTVNRGSIQNRGEWAATAGSIRNQDSPVNMAAVAHLDAATRTFTINLEMYYTSDVTDPHMLHIALLQNNVMGQQTGAGYNPDYIEGNLYRHMHMFRTLLTGQWGNEIATTTQGTFIDTTITYTVPASIDGLAIDDLSDLEFVAFITNNPNHKSIVTGTKVQVITDYPILSGIKVERGDCSLDFQPYVTIVNSTESDINSFTFNYDGSSITVNKTIASFETDTIHMPVTTISVDGSAVQNCSTTKTVSLTSCVTAGGTTMNVNADTKDITFADFNIYTVEGPIKVRYGIDGYGDEARVSLVNQSNCTALWTEGPWSRAQMVSNPQNISQLPDARYYEIDFTAPSAGLYILRMLDGYGDGWTWTNDDTPSGLWVSNANGQIVSETWGYSHGPEFSEYDVFLNITNAGDGNHTLGIENEVETVSLNAYPNPASSVATVTAGSIIRSLEVVNALGQKVSSVQNVNADRYEMNVSGMESGVYFLSVTTDNGTATQRLTVVK